MAGGEPTSLNLNINDWFSLRAAVDGTPPYLVQWYQDDAPIAGATNLSYTEIATPDLDGARFKVSVSNEFGGILSSNAILTVLPAYVSAWGSTRFRGHPPGAAQRRERQQSSLSEPDETSPLDPAQHHDERGARCAARLPGFCVSQASPKHRVCARCGAELNSYAPEGQCPQCMLKAALGGESEPPVPNQRTEAGRQTESVSSKPGPGFPIDFGDYELLEEIAHGGMGIVYRARQISLDRIVAVKRLLLGALASPEYAQRFRTEAAAAASLQHPNIVAIHEVGFHDGQHFFAMDYVAGRSLADIVRDGPLPARRATGYVKTIAQAIEYAHQRSILHRDLKPSNVLIDEQDQPRVTDFGLAKRLEKDSDLTLSGQVLGSPSYMPPEQAAAHRGLVGKRSDVYSLGAILYHLLTGRPPFVAPTVAETLQQVQSAEPVSPTVLNPGLPRDLKTICLKCLEKEPARRYQTAQDLADELGRFLNREPILARPVSRPEKAWRWCRRKPLVASLSAAVALVFLAGFAGVLWQWQQSEKNRAMADANLYAADMNLAQQAIKLNNLGRARRLLERHRPKPGAEDLRGWEWRYLWQLTRSSALVTLTNRPKTGFAASFSPDGTRLAVGWNDGRVDLWDVPGRRLVQALTGRNWPHQGRVAFSPVRNLLAATSEPKVVTLYDLDSGRESILWRAPVQGGWDVRDLSFSQDGSRVVIYAGSTSLSYGGSTPELGDAVWVVNVSSSQIESRHPTLYSDSPLTNLCNLPPHFL